MDSSKLTVFDLIYNKDIHTFMGFYKNFIYAESENQITL